MKKYALICYGIFLSVTTYAQTSKHNFQIIDYNLNNQIPNHIKLAQSDKQKNNSLSIENWIIQNLNTNNQFKLKQIDSTKDIAHNTHIRYKQYYQDIPIEGSMINLHCKGEHPESFNGSFYPQLQVDLNIIINEEQALAKAMQNYPEGTLFAWENAAIEPLKQHALSEEKIITQYPKAEKVILSKNASEKYDDFRLAYQFSLYTVAPNVSYKNIYIDVQNGSILLVRDMIYHLDNPAVAYTKYSGIRPIVCDKIDSNLYTLTERNRGLDSIYLTNSKAPPYYKFYNKDTIWNNHNPQKDEVAGDVMWGLEKTYDYYKDKFSRNSFDNKGHSVRGVLHDGKDNAYWSSIGQANFGDGNDTTYDAWTSIDIVGHEFTHGVTEKTANLYYEKESGALNESYSDIFGKCVEHYALPDSFTWGLAQRIAINGYPAYRSFSDPNSRNHPKYYKGKYYNDTTNTDNYGVHTNSSVQNYWFYLLSEGGMGLREADSKPYNVHKIGIDTAGIIAYYTLTNYLTPTSKFIDAAKYSVAATRLLFGDSSHLVQEVIMAWYAVGVLNTTAIEETPLSQTNLQFQIYPNPTSDLLYVQYRSNIDKLQLQLYDMLGRKQLTNIISQQQDKIIVDLHALPIGFYILETTYNIEKQFHKVIKN